MSSGFYDDLKGLGQQFDTHVLEQTRALVNQLPRTVRDDPVVKTRSMRYGPHERQCADIYSAGSTSKGLLAFIPGGGFVGGSRLGYRDFGEHFARQGFVVAIADYRLAPLAPWPAGAEDVSTFVTALANSSGNYGCDDVELVLIGHSAGATHVACAAFNDRFNSAIKSNVDHLVLVSGLYHFPFFGMADNVRAYIGTAEESYADRSPVAHVSGDLCPTLIVAAELDPAPFLASALSLAAQMQEMCTRPAHLHYVARHNHISPILSVGTPYDALSGMMEKFLSYAG